MAGEYTTVAQVGDIPTGQGATFVVEDRMVAVFNDAGSYFAIDDLCPHMGASLGAGYVDEGHVACPWHAWRFCIRSGGWSDNPRIAVDTFDVRVVDNDIQVRLTPSADSQQAEDTTAPAAGTDSTTDMANSEQASSETARSDDSDSGNSDAGNSGAGNSGDGRS